MHRIVRALLPAITPSRLLHVAKTAAAATLAWYAGHLVPGEANAYAYYAPLGALVASVPTVAGSVRSSMQVVVGVLLGVLASGALVTLGTPVALAVPVAVGVGTLLAGIPAFGAGRDYIPIAALFVFVVGGANPDGFSIGYVVQMAVGAAIGVGLNLLIPPTTGTKQALEALGTVKTAAADAIKRATELPGEELPQDALDDWRASLRRLETQLTDAKSLVGEVQDNLRGNARRLRSKFDSNSAQGQLDSLSRIVRHIAELQEPFLERSWSEAQAESSRALAAAGEQIAQVMRAWEDPDDDLSPRLSAASTALEDLQQLEFKHHTGWDPPSQRRTVTIYALRKIVTEVQYRVDGEKHASSES
ncbi:aromatic acid exporter family protein [Pseudoclavibacter terrae]|uniref:FUSC family protein n=1 Tax=Pseudoclavibacter terrae TaxID=1530195 RepID=A0A7J5B4X0_9MICO|nr:hypothetical protein [Pseudoclavibacter terrae]KAB1639206.1 hypothetical protein F8O03_02365 [Pseudoclavibacter terrae]